MKPLYSVKLPDYRHPKTTITYYGDEDAIINIISHVIDSFDKQQILSKVGEYFYYYNRDCILSINDEPESQLISPVRMIDNTKHLITPEPFSFDFETTCDGIYIMTADSCDISLGYMEDVNGRFIRCIKPTFINLAYKSEGFSPHALLCDTMYGVYMEYCSIDAYTGAYKPIFWSPDKVFKSEDDLLSDIQNPDPTFDFASFFQAFWSIEVVICI